MPRGTWGASARGRRGRGRLGHGGHLRAHGTPSADSPVASDRDRRPRCRVSAYRPSGRTLVDLLEGAAARYGDRTALRLRRDDGSQQAWSYRELDRRSRLVAWRLRSRGLQPGDRLLTWSPSCPELAAVYFGAMRAGLILVPLDLRMAPDAIRPDRRPLGGAPARDRDRSRRAGPGRGRPRPPARSRRPTTSARSPGPGFPADWEAAGRRPGRGRPRTTSTCSSTRRARPARRRA